MSSGSSNNEPNSGILRTLDGYQTASGRLRQQQMRVSCISDDRSPELFLLLEQNFKKIIFYRITRLIATYVDSTNPEVCFSRDILH